MLVSLENLEVSKPKAAAISITPVKYTMYILKGITSGNMAIINSVLKKCAVPVTTSMIDKAILPMNEMDHFPLSPSLLIKKAIVKLTKRNINGVTC